MQEPILGSVKDRIKTDLRLPKGLMEHVEHICNLLGIPKNAFFTLAGVFFLLKLSPILVLKKRSSLYKDMQNLFESVIANAKSL